MRYAAICTLLGAILCGCAGGAQVPAQRLTSATAAVHASEEVSAAEGPPAARLHVRMAQDQLDRARALIARGEGDRVELLLLGAQTDAELAISLTRERQAELSARQAIEQVQALRERLRKGPTLTPGGG